MHSIDNGPYDWFEQNGYGDEEIEPVTTMFLCESTKLFLRPKQLYYFEVDEGCKDCVKAASHYR